LDGIIGNFLNTEKPSGTALVKFLFYLGIIDDDWDEALWGVIKTPFMTILNLLGLRLALDIIMALFKIRDDVSDSSRAVKSSEPL